MTLSRFVITLALLVAGPAFAQGVNPTLKPSSGGTGLSALGSGVAAALGSTAGANGGFALFNQLGSGAFASAYALPAATATVLGGVKPDGTTIGNIGGVISVTYGTAANTAAQGNDSRITGAAQTANNLSDLASVPTARTNLGLGPIATISPGTGVAAALAASLNATGGLVGYSGALGTPTQAVLTNATGLPLSTGVTGTLQAAQEPAHTGDVTNSAGSLALTIAPGAVTSAKMASGAAAANLGFTPLNPANNLSELASASTARANLGLGAIATISPGTGVAAALAASLNATGGLVGYSGALGTPTQAVLTNATGLPLSTGVTGTLQAAQEPAHTGDVTNSAGSLALTIAPGAVTSAKMASGAAAANLGFTPLTPANNLSDLSSASTARSNLGLGALATQNTLGAGAVTASMLATGAAASNLGFAFPFVTLNSSNGATDFFDLSGARQFEIYPFPGAVNYYAIQGNIANGGPTLSVQGSDANIDADIAAKGTGSVVLGNGLGTLAQFNNYNALPNTVWPLIESAQGGTVIYSAGGSGANISINMLPIGTGGFSAGPAQTVTGTNATALGSSNKASGYASTAIGIASYAQGAYSLSTGAYAFDNSVVGKRSHSSAHLGSARGTTQISEQVFAATTSSATPVTATSDAGGSSTLNTIQVQPNQTVASRILIVARNTSTGASAMWNALAYWNEGATASTLALVYSTGTGAPLASTGTGSTWTATLGTNTTTGYGYVICTGAAGETIRWTVRVDNVEDMNG